MIPMLNLLLSLVISKVATSFSNVVVLAEYILCIRINFSAIRDRTQRRWDLLLHDLRAMKDTQNVVRS